MSDFGPRFRIIFCAPSTKSNSAVYFILFIKNKEYNLQSQLQFNLILWQRVPVSYQSFRIYQTVTNSSLWTVMKRSAACLSPKFLSFRTRPQVLPLICSCIENCSHLFIRNKFEFAFASSAYYPNDISMFADAGQKQEQTDFYHFQF